MSQFCRISLAHWCVPAFLAVAGQSIAAPGTASAACGDYVMLRGQSQEHVQLPAPQVAVETVVHGKSSSAPVRPRPCFGPQCSGEVPRPFGAPVEPLKIVVRYWGMLPVIVGAVASEWGFARFADDPGSAPIDASLLFRPPR